MSELRVISSGGTYREDVTQVRNVNLIGSFVGLVVELVLCELEQRADRISVLLERIGVNRCQTEPDRLFVSVSEYADRIGVCKRTVENWIKKGLPLIGSGKSRRVPVDEADKWMRNGGPDGELERAARQNAKRHVMDRLPEDGYMGCDYEN